MLSKFVGEADAYNGLSEHSLPAEILRLGRVNSPHGPLVANLGDWTAGDLVLSSEPSPNIFNPITTYQRFIYPGWDVHRWTHVGVYDGRGLIWDANPDANIQSRSVTDYLLKKPVVKLVRFRQMALSAAALDDALISLSKTTYDMPSLGLLLLARVLGMEDANTVVNSNTETAICSTFVERVYWRCGVNSIIPKIRMLVPADFAADPSFYTVPIQWCRPSAAP
ncbi:MAG: hypothetical protein JWR51_3356 [Devosia sp.]|uniref:hypothetical protein n=1 Tax=Devosia sp. TaxID=1871048 RepID=UPI00263990F4|nr:hypothetical protein [Devosia sp.]MDB5530253.1 hypothetical protein [Devosia sp.]